MVLEKAETSAHVHDKTPHHRGQGHVYIYEDRHIRELSLPEHDGLAKQHKYASFQELIGQVMIHLGLKHGDITVAGSGGKITETSRQP